MNRFISRLFQMFQPSATSVQDTFITLLTPESRHVPHGFVTYEDIKTGIIETMDFSLNKPELLYEIGEELMEQLAGELSNLSFLLMSVHSFQYQTYRQYEPTNELKEYHA